MFTVLFTEQKGDRYSEVLQVVVVISASRCVGFLLLLLLNSEMTDIWSLIACVHLCGDCVVRLNSKMSRICLSEVLGVSL